MDILDFVIENYIWFLIGGIVIIMTVVGYFAEKTEFGKKQVNKNNDEEVKEDKNSSSNSDTLPAEEITIDQALESIPKEEPMASLEEEEVNVKEVPDKVEKSLAFDLPKKEESEEIPEELYSGLDGTPNTYKNKPSSDDLDLDLPNLDSLKDDIDSDNSDDDIWKF